MPNLNPQEGVTALLQPIHYRNPENSPASGNAGGAAVISPAVQEWIENGRGHEEIPEPIDLAEAVPATLNGNEISFPTESFLLKYNFLRRD